MKPRPHSFYEVTCPCGKHHAPRDPQTITCQCGRLLVVIPAADKHPKSA